MRNSDLTPFVNLPLSLPYFMLRRPQIVRPRTYSTLAVVMQGCFITTYNLKKILYIVHLSITSYYLQENRDLDFVPEMWCFYCAINLLKPGLLINFDIEQMLKRNWSLNSCSHARFYFSISSTLIGYLSTKLLQHWLRMVIIILLVTDSCALTAVFTTAICQ